MKSPTTTKSTRPSLQYFRIAFAIVNFTYLASWLTYGRSWAPGWANFWPLPIYIILNLAMVAYALVQPKIQKLYLDIIFIIGFILLLLIDLLSMLTFSAFSGSLMLILASTAMIFSSLFFLFAKVFRKTTSRRISLIFILGTLPITLITFIRIYVTWWPRSIYMDISNIQYITILLTVGISGLFWMARIVGWVIVLRLMSTAKK